MDETSGQAPHEPENQDKRERPNSHRQIDWDAGFALYCQGRSANFIGKAIGVRREAVQIHVRTDQWKFKRERARELTAQMPEIKKKPPEPNEQVALDLDRAAGDIIALVTARIEELKTGGNGAADQIQKLTYSLARAGQLRRQSRGMAANEGFAPREDRKLEVVIRRLPATKVEYDALPSAEPESVPA